MTTQADGCVRVLNICRYGEANASSIQDTKKRDRIVRKIHSLFINGADNPICAVASDIANRFFHRAVAHSAVCRSEACAAHLYKATVPSIACEAVCHSIDSFLGKIDYEQPELTVEESVVLDAQTMLEKSLTDYKKHHNVSESMKRAFATVLTMSKHQLCVSCDIDANATSRLSKNTDGEETSVEDIHLQRLCISLQSLSTIGWTDATVVEKSHAFCNSPEGYEWTKAISGWNTDLVALMIATAASAEDNRENMSNRLKKRASNDRIAWESIEQQMATLPF